jgi:hypothetical protein
MCVELHRWNKRERFQLGQQHCAHADLAASANSGHFFPGAGYRGEITTARRLAIGYVTTMSRSHNNQMT